MERKNINTRIDKKLCDKFYERYGPEERRDLLEDCILKILEGSITHPLEKRRIRINKLDGDETVA